MRMRRLKLLTSLSRMKSWGEWFDALFVAMTDRNEGVDPELLRAWLDARSMSRGLPLSVEDRGSFRVDTAQFEDEQRFVFAKASSDVTAVARSISVPWILIKLCGTRETLRALLPQNWQVRPPSWFMAKQGRMQTAPLVLPPNYTSAVQRVGPVFAAAIQSDDGKEVAGGRAVLHQGVFVYDQIATADDHRRRGLGRAIMLLLQEAGCESAATQVLTATPDGRALYTALGWEIVSEYCTGEISG